MIEQYLKSADILLIVPPFSRVHSQSLAMHTLQGIARAEGFSVSVFYANLHFAALIGEDYQVFENMRDLLLGERVFARAAFGIEGAVGPDIYETRKSGAQRFVESSNPLRQVFLSLLPPIPTLQRVEERATAWVEDVSRILSQFQFSLVGCTTMFEQTNVSLALLRSMKQLRPGITTLIGGFNCDGEMAHGMASHDPQREFLDFIFSGESEESFTQFLRDYRRGTLPRERIIQGKPLLEMDSLPDLDLDDYFTQLYALFPEYRQSWADLSFTYESSRGCSWGEKRPCTFCGYDGHLRYRMKSPGRVQRDLERLRQYAPRKVEVADLIMPDIYFEQLLPGLKGEEDSFLLFIEQRVNLDYRHLKVLHNANVIAQPGIETLSDPLLRHMRKGTLARQNLAFLRDATSLGIGPLWNFLWGFPNEKVEFYEEMLGFLPTLFHLHPPNALLPLGIFRYSVYFREPERFGLENLRPLPSYNDVFPGTSDLGRAAYFFRADYDAETLTHLDVIERLAEAIGQWNQSWAVPLLRPRLEIVQRKPGEYSLIDTRRLPGTTIETPLIRERAAGILRAERYENREHQNWAIENRAALNMKGYFVSLVTASAEIHEELLGE